MAKKSRMIYELKKGLDLFDFRIDNRLVFQKECAPACVLEIEMTEKVTILERNEWKMKVSYCAIYM